MRVVLSVLAAGLMLGAAMLFAHAQSQTQNPKPGEVMYVTPAEVTKLTSKVVDGVATHFLVRKDAYGQELVYRTASGVPEVHANSADHFVVIEGAATLVVGGKVVNSKQTSPGEIRGTSITGGKEYALTPGANLTVPPGVPHWTVLKPGAHFRAVVFKLKD
jgi:mannose-6-phosphate isomerase-like protein (cupin superfamily)